MERIREIEDFIVRIGAVIMPLNKPGAMGAYWPGDDDYITMPTEDVWEQRYGDKAHLRYYQAVFHELSHWAHPRMGLDYNTGDELLYTVGELVAEGSACWLYRRMRLGTPNDEYTKHQEKKLKKLLKGRDAREFNIPGKINDTYLFLLEKGKPRT